MILLLALLAQQTPAEEYRALVKEYQTVRGGGGPMTDEERTRFVGQVYRKHDQVALKLLDLAERHPRDPVAFDALVMAVWQVNTIPWPVELVGNETGWVRAFEILRRDHLRSEKLAPLCERISYGLRKEYGEFLRAALEGNPHPDVQAAACLGLARYLGNRAARVESIGDRVREFEELYGKEYIASLRGQDPGREIEALLDRAVKEFGTRKTPSGESIAEKAGAELFERRHLAVGREAPDIEGEDHEGARFRLRDYRGKVVLLDFWSYV